MQNAAEAYLSLLHCINSPVLENYKALSNNRNLFLAKALATFCVSQPSDEGYALVFQQPESGQRLKIIISGTEPGPEPPVHVRDHLSSVFQQLKDIATAGEFLTQTERNSFTGHSQSSDSQIPPHMVSMFSDFNLHIISFGRERTRSWMHKHYNNFGSKMGIIQSYMSDEQMVKFKDVWKHVDALKEDLDAGDNDNALFEQATICDALSDAVLLAGIRHYDTNSRPLYFVECSK